jgi:hypothetical protein
MPFSPSRLGPLVGAVAAALVLAACGGGEKDSGEQAPAKDSPPSKADFQKAEKALSGLQRDYQAAYDAGARLQKASVAYFKSHPTGTPDDAALDSVRTAFADAVQKRDETADEVEKLDALKDPDVAKAYETFSTKAEKGDQYHDTLFAAFPLLQQVFTTCGDVFTSTKLATSPSSATGFGRSMLARYRPAIADCLPPLKELSHSENADLATFGAGFIDVVEQRRTLMTRLSSGDLAMATFTRRYEQVGARMKKVSEKLDFQKQLNALSPVPEFLALQKVVTRKAA